MKNSRLKFFIVLFSVLFIGYNSNIYADYTAKEIIEKVQSKYKTVSDITAKFSQTVKYRLSQIEQTFNGTLYVKKEKKYRIETEQQILLTDGITSWAFNHQNNQLVIDNYKDDKNTVSPDKFLLEYPEDYYSALVGKEKVAKNQTYILKLTPKNENSFIKSMKVWVDDDEWFIRKIEWTDINDNTSSYTVKKIEINTKLGDEKFQFTAPKGVQVVDLR
jgi:outer membrane lipoprotein carrier protein